MRCFTVLLDPIGEEITPTVLSRYEVLPKARGWEFAWQRFPGLAVLTSWDDAWGTPLTARDGNWVAVGEVRLDNRRDLERWTDLDHPEYQQLSDLALLLRVVARHGTKYIPQFLGDFAFVVWDGGTHTAIAASDAFGVRRLYYAECDHLFAFASRAEVLSLDDRYEPRYLAELVAMHEAPRDITVYAGVQPFPAASVAVLERGALTLHQYWDPVRFDVEYTWEKSEREAVDACRTLLADSVRLRLGDIGETWAHLSGGLDSSSVVSMVQWLAERGQLPHGLSGTVTFVDRQGTGTDERDYSETVVDRWHLHNETIVDSPTWYDSRFEPPLTDQPGFDLQLYPRECLLAAVVRTQGGRVVLTGVGGDELFMGSMLFLADWVVQGHFVRTVREMAHRAAVGRVSFWTLAYKNAVLPVLPLRARRQLAHDDDSPIQPWLVQAGLRQYGVSSRSSVAGEYEGVIGRKYQHSVAAKIATLPAVTRPGIAADRLDLRHPLLYRPLVEFALRLPPRLRARPHAHRWILREAMRGILPDKVRTRIGKQDTGEVVAWSLAAARAELSWLLEAPMLADLGILDPRQLRAAFKIGLRSTRRQQCLQGALCATLAVEGWLQLRSGRWPCGSHLSSIEASPS